MLTELLSLLEQSQGELNLDAIAQRLQAQPSAVAGMVELLVRKGWLLEVGPACGICDSCSMSSQCNIPPKRARRYMIARPRSVTAPES